jgi:tRNA-dihydrouridine synthase B
MLEPNDIAFRLLCKKAGCGLTYTGMINPLTKKEFSLEDKPALQLFCTSPKGIKEFMKKYDSKVSLWDFNLGCPSVVAKKLGFGSFLHKDLKTIREIILVMRENTNKPLTIKLRKSENALKISKMAEEIGVDAIAIHPRTEQQGYSGKPDYDFALKLKKSVHIPVIYSGDVNLKNASEILKDFDFVMVGREAIGNPSIFSEFLKKKKKKKFSFRDYLNLAKKYNLFFREIKYHAMAFTKDYSGAKEKRKEIVFAKNVEDLERLF